MLYIIYLLAGVFIGVIVTVLIVMFRLGRLVFGYLKFQENDDGDPYLFLDLDRRPEEMLKHKYVLFRTPRE